MIKISLEELAKRYSGQEVFSAISWQPEEGKFNLVTGPNGSGKSTLLRLICGLESPSGGLVKISQNGATLSRSEVRSICGLVTPDLTLYRHLSALENLQFFAKINGFHFSPAALKKILARVGLAQSANLNLAAFSTGMKQRLKLAYAIYKEPALLVLDEPASNLDQEGRDMLAGILEEYKHKSLVIMATNEQEEVRQYGENVLFLAGGR